MSKHTLKEIVMEEIIVPSRNDGEKQASLHTPQASFSNEAQVEASKSSSRRDNQANPLLGVLRFKATVQQRTDVDRLEKDFEKLMSRRYGSHGTSGSISGSVGPLPSTGSKQFSMNQILRNPGDHGNFFSEILNLLKQYKHLVRLPDTPEIMSELAKPFFNSSVNADDCNQALNVFEFMKANYKPVDENENFERILWCCRLLETRHVLIRSRLCEIVEKFINSTAMNSFFPASVTSIHSLIYTFVHTLVVISGGAEKSEESIRLNNMINGFLERLAAGTLILVDNEISIGNSSKARYIFMEGLIKCILVKNVQLQKYVMANLIPKYWITPDPTANTFYEHFVQLFAQAALGIFSDSSYAIDIENLHESLPYIIIQVLNKYFPAKDLRDMPSHIVRSLAKVALSSFILARADDSPSRTSSFMPTTENQRSTFIPKNESSASIDIQQSYDDSRRKSSEKEKSPDRQPSLDDSRANHKQTDNEILRLARSYIKSLWGEGWKKEIIGLVKETLEQERFEKIIAVFEQMVFGINDDIGREIVSVTKIVSLQPENSPGLKKLLLALSSNHSAEFYKPMIACVASDSEQKVSEHLHLISTLGNYMSGVELFMQNAELMSVVILSDVGSGTPKAEMNKHESKLSVLTTSTISKVPWGTTTLGQCAITMEFIWVIRQLRLQQSGHSKDVKAEAYAKNFLKDLELRLAVFMIAKEKTSLVPMPLRVLLSNLFFEIRLYCKITYRPGWLSKIVDWLILSAPGKDIYRDLLINGDLSSNLDVDPNQLSEVELIFQRVKVVYATLDDWTSADLERGDLLSDPVPAISKVIPVTSLIRKTLTSHNYARNRLTVLSTLKTSHHPPLSKQRLHRLNNFNEDHASSILALLVTIYFTLSNDEYSSLGPYIWDRFLNDREHKQFSSACFLFIQCSEKSPEIVKGLVMRDLYSTNALVRAMTIRKISSLFGHRNQLLSQPYVSDSSRRRPFRTQAPHILFVPTELGSQDMVMYETFKAQEVTNDTLSADVRKRIQELGWEEEDQSDQEQIVRVATPISLLPTFYLDEEESKNAEESASTQSNEKKNNAYTPFNNKMQLNSNKRRTVSIPILSTFSLRFVDLLDDTHGGVYNLAKELITYFLRDDALLFLRNFFSDLGLSKSEAQKELLTRIQFLVSMQHNLPSNFTYTLFNHLAGMLKWYSRDNMDDGLSLMTYVLPILAEMVPSVNGIVVRDFRKNKIENIICNNGQFWFTEGTPITMFPRNLTDNQTSFDILDVPLELFEVAILRIGHIHFMTNYAVKCPREVYSIKKLIHAFEPLPSCNGSGETKAEVDDDQILPDMKKMKRWLNEHDDVFTRRRRDFKLLSALRARSWLNFLLELLRRLNENYNDRNELELFLSGANNILLEHAGDFGIVGQTLVLFMTAATRFRRLFDTNRGYSIIIPVLFKIFCESESVRPIRQAIIFAWCKFFHAHGESFIFQALGCLTPLILKGSSKSPKVCEWMCTSLYELFRALNFPVNFEDSLGILDAAEELDISDPFLFDAPSIINNTINNTFGLKGNVKLKTSFLGAQDKIFPLEDLVKLFLTIIAYDPGSLRAEQFVQILRYLIPHLLQESSTVRGLVDEGMVALTEVFLKFSKSSKPLVSSTGVSGSAIIDNISDENMDTADGISFNIQEATTQAFGKQWQQNDRIKIKRQFLMLVQVYKLHDGMLTDNCHNKMANIIRLMLKDYASVKMKISTAFLKNYICDALLFNTTFVDGRKPILSFLRHLSTSFRQHYKSIDFSGLLEGLALIATSKCKFAINDFEMAHLLKDKFVSFGLSIALRSDWEIGAEQTQQKFCNGLVELFVAMMTHSKLDMLSEIDKYHPSHYLMTYIIIPICLKYNPEDVVIVSKIESPEFNIKITWNRLLVYVTKVCSKDFTQRSTRKPRASTTSMNNVEDLEANENEEETQVDSTADTATFIFGYIALKILFVRADKYISQTKGMWVNIAQFLRKNLASSGKPQASRSGLYSGGSSPSESFTNVSITPDLHPDNLRASSTSLLHPPLSRSSLTSSAYDFVLWKFLEFILLYKLPLNLYLRTFVHQKLQHRSTGIDSIYYRLSSIDNSKSSNHDTRKSRWRSWGGPPIGFQQALNKSLEKESIGFGSVRKGKHGYTALTGDGTTSTVIESTNDLNNNLNVRSKSPNQSLYSGVLHTNELVNETFNSYSNVCTLMGYKTVNNNTSGNTQQELRAWCYNEVIKKLNEEMLFVSNVFKGAFKTSEFHGNDGNNID
ncbi:1095_t:CDS:10 [Acaulospora morrowiae]|uniref:1095_t:CDS:1 n=1 Tax=Acaulospora morrowiae TaxID=94023 RepID=A0A9N8YPW1_9GLOM|nr:1095_t:CDS:10 [Acaulospora morrowiae]